MSANLSLERQLGSVMAEEAIDPGRDVLLDDILATTARLRPEARWLALLKEPPMRTDSRVAVGLPTRGLILAAIVAALVLGGIAAALIGANLLKPPLQPAVTDDWPGFRGDATHLGVAQTGPIGRPVVNWELHAQGAIATHLAIVGDIVYAASDDGALHALSRATGSELWTFAADGVSSPLVDGGSLFLKLGSGVIVALNAPTGAEQWRSTAYEGPTVLVANQGSIVFGTGDGSIVALDAKTGSERWRTDVADSGVGNPASDGSRIFAGIPGADFVAVDASTGEIAWRQPLAGDLTGTATVANGIAYIGASGDTDTTPLRAFDAASGTPLWESEESLASPAVADGVAYSGSTTGLVAALDAATGEVRWRIQLDGSVRAPALAGGVLYLTADAELRIYAVEPATGRVYWSFDVDGSNQCCIAAARGAVWMGTQLGTVYSIGGDGSAVTPVALAPRSPEPSPVEPSGPPAESASPVSPIVEVVRDIVDPDRTMIPNGLAFDAEGRIWAIDPYHHRFAIFAADGSFLEFWGTAGDADGEFDLVRSNGDGAGGVAFGPDGRIYVLDIGKRRVQVFSQDRTFLTSWGGFGGGPGTYIEPTFIASAPDGTILVLDESRGVIERYDGDGSVVSTFDAFPNATGGFASTNGMAVDAENNVYLSQMTPHQVTKFDPAGNVLQVFGDDGPGKWAEQPGFIAVDNVGRVFISQGPNRGTAPGVEVFAPDGTYLGGFGELGSDTEVVWPTALLLDGAGTLYVIDVVDPERSGDSKIRAFRLLPPFAP
jgi:outer membrane protein assembly factor BamB